MTKSLEVKTSSKDIVVYFCNVFSKDISSVNWAQQIITAKKLLNVYTDTQIKFAIDLFKSQNKNIYSLGYLLTSMGKIPDLLRAEVFINSQEGESIDRNQRRLAENNEARSREKYHINLFEEPK
jgi:hypothetical protein